MERTVAPREGAIRFIIMLIGILVLLNIGQHFTWNTQKSEQTNLSWPELSLKLAFAGLNKPTHITSAGDGSKRLFVTEQGGRILIIKGTAQSKKTFLDISPLVSCCGERGLLSLVFPPKFKEKKYFYVNYTDRSGDSVIARYHLTQDPDIADPKSGVTVLTVEQPYANHNGGQLAFGPDGYLYIGMGDGGSAGDPLNHAQNPSSLLGKMLRIDVEAGERPYVVPRDNPFAGNRTYRPEIWALGLRNPWRFSFDRKTGDLFIADVGQDKYEEIDFEKARTGGGMNYGWNIAEGQHCYKAKDCDRGGMAFPVSEYDHSLGCSVTGGMVYRGARYPAMQGVYFYGDYCSGRLWGLRQSASGWENRMLRETGLSISTFGEDEDGELYVADYGKGNIYTIESGAR